MNAKAKTKKTQLDNPVAIFQTSQDLKNALLALSLVINLFIFTAWLVVQVDPSVSLMLIQTK